MKVVIGQGSCGIATGAKKTESEFLEQIKRHNVDVDLTVTGCVGTCLSLIHISKPTRH